VSAGIGEELFYRGFLLWYLGTVVSTAGAVVVSSTLFGLAHVMHGASAAARAGLLGVVFCGLYLWTGSLWVPMLLHTAIDWFSGRAAFVTRR
jgi:membrane protease YdiL (CAAX protease family)